MGQRLALGLRSTLLASASRKPDAERVPMGGAPVPFQTTLWALWRGHWLRVGLPGSLLGAASTCSRRWRLLPPQVGGPVRSAGPPRGLNSLTWGSQRLPPSLWRQDRDPLGAVQPLSTADGRGAHLFLSRVLCCQQMIKHRHSLTQLWKVSPWSHHVLTACSCCIDRGGGTFLAMS